ncbi:MAG TPA: HAMP domain-containing sensor histidine kinase [Longimicrobiaceae bacterium]|nr:HAMP domain-containing sensor histidine kinase [Longimicrobiaceae bacterium]
MISARRSSRMAPGSAFLVVLLLLMLGLSGVLAYQALDAARSELRSTERALRGYAAFAAWELVRRADDSLSRRLAASAARALPPDAARGPSSRGDSAVLASLIGAARREMRWCGCPEAVRGAFLVAGGPGRRAARVSDGRDGLRAWLETNFRGDAPGARPLVVSGGDRLLAQPALVGGRRILLVYRLVPERGGGEPRAHGVALDPARLVPPVFREVVRSTPLLPASIRGGFTNEDALAVMVATREGEVVYRSHASLTAAQDGSWLDAKVGRYRPDALAPGEVVEPLGGLFAGLTVRVAVRPEVAAGRVDEGPAGDRAPRSRLPILLTVFTLTLGLVCVAIFQLRRQQELVRLRDDFVSGVSHELRTPLAQIRLFADLLESERLRDPEQHRRSIRIINEEARRLTYLVENILHFSRAQRGTGRIAPNPVEMGPLLREIVESFAPLARTRGTEFALELDEGVIARVDRDALRQVLLNLLDNAVKYGPRGQRVRVGMRLAGLTLRIWVDDQGPGIPVGERLQVWEPYRRLERDADSASTGSGIGLSVVRDLVALHGGRVRVEEAPGGGARFVVELFEAMYAGPPGEAHPEEPASTSAGVIAS